MSPTPDSRTKARASLLAMAEEWDRAGKTQHAIETYEAVIESDLGSAEADAARAALHGIAQQFRKARKVNSAYHLYHKLADGRAGRHVQ